ncbi:MAG: hypothetical protein ACFCD0_26025 [Gemmataceae bacterium]
MAQVNRIVTRLKAVPEGKATMFDNTTIIYMPETGAGHHGPDTEAPMVIMSGNNSRLDIAGRYIRLPFHATEGHKTLSNWYTTLLNAYGNPIEHYGDLNLEMTRRRLAQVGPHPTTDEVESLTRVWRMASSANGISSARLFLTCNNCETSDSAPLRGILCEEERCRGNPAYYKAKSENTTMSTHGIFRTCFPGRPISWIMTRNEFWQLCFGQLVQTTPEARGFLDLEGQMAVA